MNLEAMWSAATEVIGFNRNASFVSHFMNGVWHTKATSNSINSTKAFIKI